MSDDLLTADNVSKELLKEVFDAAFMNTALDKDGDLYVQEQCRCFTFFSEDDKKKRVIRLRTYFSFSTASSELQRLIAVNQMNINYLLIRAIVNERMLMFGYDVALDGGISKKALVQLVKRFCAIPHNAVADYGKEIVD